MAKCVDIKKAWDFGVLCDWFINSIDETEPPCWTPEHIEELLDGFYVIPKRKEIAAPVFDAEPVMQWISVKDRLPEEGEKVLIYTKTDITTFGLYTKNYGFGKREGFECGDGFMWMNTSSHWMPLPKPPEGE